MVLEMASGTTTKVETNKHTEPTQLCLQGQIF